MRSQVYIGSRYGLVADAVVKAMQHVRLTSVCTTTFMLACMMRRAACRGVATHAPDFCMHNHLHARMHDEA